METILITGANRGIGLALTEACLNKGYAVLATYRDEGSCGALKALGGEHAELSLMTLSLDDEASILALAEGLQGRKIDVLINNAGVMGPTNQSLTDMDSTGWLNAFAINTIAPFTLSRLLLDNLSLAERPRIVTVSSQMGSLNRVSKGAFAYRSSKAAVNKVMQVMALELQEQGIIVCPVHPGWVQTDMGGSEAEITAEQSAVGILELVEKLQLEHSGRFWTWQGEEHPW
ncbi:SDR family oxidoreductase [Motilimonas sp. E26]|uniref:SDR family oxidoreductase n=1 Tax=Motilimonas sp. E26 TaxID=2865674 RepID=UPI001E29AF97|nr:SDR family oxidoreductase [Motilimonas sp. E26]MCE0556979.1 SDR family oxidoreductase [Motilimonas sp. E26]